MPFTKTNISEEIKQMKKEDKEFAKIYEIVEKEHALIRQAANIRKEMKHPNLKWLKNWEPLNRLYRDWKKLDTRQP